MDRAALRREAIAWFKNRLAAIPPVSFRLMKEAMRRPVVERVRASEAADKAAREAWGSDEVRAAIRRFLKETFGTDTR